MSIKPGNDNASVNPPPELDHSILAAAREHLREAAPRQTFWTVPGMGIAGAMLLLVAALWPRETVVMVNIEQVREPAATATPEYLSSGDSGVEGGILWTSRSPGAVEQQPAGAVIESGGKASGEPAPLAPPPDLWTPVLVDAVPDPIDVR